MPSGCSLLKKPEENYDAEKVTLEQKRTNARDLRRNSASFSEGAP